MSPTIRTLLSETEIEQRVDQMAAEIARDYEGKDVLLVGVLRGAFMFMADLSRQLWKHGMQSFEIDFIGISSYGNNLESSKNPRITLDLSEDVQGRHVILVEDIVDTGYSLDALQRLIGERQPASLHTVVLLSKTSRREIEVEVSYMGFEIDGWIEGYGLDTNRGRPEVVVLE